jgi:alpha-tubulin suppressor-like RCC1 family protein
MSGPQSCGVLSPSCSTVPVPVSGLSGVTQIASGGGQNLALLDNTTVMAWGDNSNGELGDANTNDSDVPVAVAGLAEVKAVAAGQADSFAIMRYRGTVMAWGYNGDGELGNGSTTDADVPRLVPGLAHVKAISGGGEHSLALLGNGTVMAWGSNLIGQLGDGTDSGPDICGSGPCRTTPGLVSDLSGVKAISAGTYFSLALLSSRTVMAWGYNGDGELGDGTTSGPDTCSLSFPCDTTPAAVSGLSGAKAVAAGAVFGLAST